MRHLVRRAFCGGDLVNRAPQVVADGRRGIEHNDALVGDEKRRLVGPVRDPKQISLNSPDVIALLVQCGPKRGRRYWHVVGQRIDAASINSSHMTLLGNQTRPLWIAPSVGRRTKVISIYLLRQAIVSCRVRPLTVRCPTYTPALSREVRTMSTTWGTVASRPQSRCSSHANDTQPIGCAPAWTMRSRPARCASSEVPPTASTTGYTS